MALSSALSSSLDKKLVTSSLESVLITPSASVFALRTFFFVFTIFVDQPMIESPISFPIASGKILGAMVLLKTCSFGAGFFWGNYLVVILEFLFNKSYSTKAYVAKTILSKIVFNTPSVHKCHGWKLGEFLAMGKPILSTPISNKLPAELIHGKHIHIATSEEELKAGVELLLSNNDYCDHLSENIKTYFESFVSPIAVIKNIVKVEIK